MAIIEPFSGIRYDLGRVGALCDVVAPPYDVVDETLQQRLYDRHPYNIIRLELTKPEPGSAEDTKYALAGRLWKNWQLDQIVRSEGQPALYALHQEYEWSGKLQTRKGIIARMRLEPYDDGNIFPHEQTFPAPKEDRFRLMEVTHANFSPVFGLYPDDHQKVQNRIDTAIARTLPIEARDHLGVTSKVWPVFDQTTIRDVCEMLHTRPVFIADGHHRYETAIQYRDSLAKKQGGLPADHPANYVLMALIGLSDPGLLILPTHRLVQGLSGLTEPILRQRLEHYFDVETIGQGDSAAQEAWENIYADDTQDVLGFGTQVDGMWMIARIKSDFKMDRLAPEHSISWQSLAVSRLHVLVIDKLLTGLGKPECQYVHLLPEVLEQMRLRRCDLACLVPPVTTQQVAAVAGAGELMLPKSTYFYPKLLTGLVFHSLK